MPTFTRRIGESFYLGDDVRVTVHDRTSYHATLRIMTLDDIAVLYAGCRLQPAVLCSGHRDYLVSLRIGERVSVGESTVWVRPPELKRGCGSMRRPGLRIGVFAPPSLRVWRSDARTSGTSFSMPPHGSEAYAAIAK